MQTLTRGRVSKVEVEMLCVQLALAAFRHPHCFGHPAVIQHVSFNDLEEANLEEVIQGRKEINFWGVVLESRAVCHRFTLKCTLKPLNSGKEMPVDIRLDDGHTVVCGYAILTEPENGGIEFEVET